MRPVLVRLSSREAEDDGHASRADVHWGGKSSGYFYPKRGYILVTLEKEILIAVKKALPSRRRVLGFQDIDCEVLHFLAGFLDLRSTD